jgi:fructose-bisphosphate aldolase class II
VGAAPIERARAGAAIADRVGLRAGPHSEAQYAYTRAVAAHMFTEYDGVLMVDGGVGRKKAYDPRTWNVEGQAGMAARACVQLGSAGRAHGDQPHR